MNRRRFLALLGSSVTAGCVVPASGPTETTPTAGEGYVRPESEPATVPEPLACDEAGSTRLPVPFGDDAVQWGDTQQFALRVDALTAEYGETVTVSLTNTTAESVLTGNETKYAIEQYTTAGWQAVRVLSSGTPGPYDDDGITHASGDGFDWRVELTEAGIAGLPSQDSGLAVCPDLRPARYRFVYWGIPGAPAVAVSFDLVRGTQAE